MFGSGPEALSDTPTFIGNFMVGKNGLVTGGLGGGLTGSGPTLISGSQIEIGGIAGNVGSTPFSMSLRICSKFSKSSNGFKLGNFGFVGSSGYRLPGSGPIGTSIGRVRTGGETRIGGKMGWQLCSIRGFLEGQVISKPFGSEAIVV